MGLRWYVGAPVVCFAFICLLVQCSADEVNDSYREFCVYDENNSTSVSLIRERLGLNDVTVRTQAYLFEASFYRDTVCRTVWTRSLANRIINEPFSLDEDISFIQGLIQNRRQMLLNLERGKLNQAVGTYRDNLALCHTLFGHEFSFPFHTAEEIEERLGGIENTLPVLLGYKNKEFFERNVGSFDAVDNQFYWDCSYSYKKNGVLKWKKPTLRPWATELQRVLLDHMTDQETWSFARNLIANQRAQLPEEFVAAPSGGHAGGPGRVELNSKRHNKMSRIHMGMMIIAVISAAVAIVAGIVFWPAGVAVASVAGIIKVISLIVIGLTALYAANRFRLLMNASMTVDTPEEVTHPFYFPSFEPLREDPLEGIGKLTDANIGRFGPHQELKYWRHSDVHVCLDSSHYYGVESGNFTQTFFPLSLPANCEFEYRSTEYSTQVIPGLKCSNSGMKMTGGTMRYHSSLSIVEDSERSGFGYGTMVGVARRYLVATKKMAFPLMSFLEVLRQPRTYTLSEEYDEMRHAIVAELEKLSSALSVLISMCDILADEDKPQSAREAFVRNLATVFNLHYSKDASKYDEVQKEIKVALRRFRFSVSKTEGAGWTKILTKELQTKVDKEKGYATVVLPTLSGVIDILQLQRAIQEPQYFYEIKKLVKKGKRPRSNNNNPWAPLWKKLTIIDNSGDLSYLQYLRGLLKGASNSLDALAQLLTVTTRLAQGKIRIPRTTFRYTFPDREDPRSEVNLYPGFYPLCVPNNCFLTSERTFAREFRMEGVSSTVMGIDCSGAGKEAKATIAEMARKEAVMAEELKSLHSSLDNLKRRLGESSSKSSTKKGKRSKTRKGSKDGSGSTGDSDVSSVAEVDGSSRTAEHDIGDGTNDTERSVENDNSVDPIG